MSQPAYITRAQADPRARAAAMAAEHHYEASKAPGSSFPAWAQAEPTYRDLCTRTMASTLERLERAGLIHIASRDHAPGDQRQAGGGNR